MWRIELLGGLRVWQGTSAVRQFRTRKAAALLGILALEPGHTHTRDSLAETLWPEEPIETARRRLRQALSLLRTDLTPLGEPPILTEGRELLRLADNVETDLVAFEHCRRHGEVEKALALYQGPLLPDFFEVPLVVARERLAKEHTDLIRSRSEKRHRPRVPVPLTPLFGRETEREQITQILGSRTARLVTLLGAGGIGKTRLALDAARSAADAFQGVVWFVLLASVSSPEGAVVAALDSLREPGEEPESSHRPPLERLVERLSAFSTVLLVVDNTEHLPGIAHLLRALLERVPGLSLLATSRQTLGISGERRIELGPLPRTAARDWFAYQAQAARIDFQLTDQSTVAVDEIVERLDGVPLALELAAAWSSALTPQEIAQHLAHSQDLLVRRDSAGDPRHTTLKDTIAASFATLPEDLRPFWLSLSVFRGGWLREAAEAICPSVALGTIAALAALRDRSLVTATETAEGLRWNLLAPLREFAEATLTPDERHWLQVRHCDHFLHFAAHAAYTVHYQDTASAFALLEREEANSTAAILFGLRATPDLVIRTINLCRGLSWHWWVRGRNHLAPQILPLFRDLGQRLDEFTGDDKGLVLRSLAESATRRGELALAEGYYQEALAVHRATGNLRYRAECTENLGNLLARQGRYPEAVLLAQHLRADYEAQEEWQEVAYWLSHEAAWEEQQGNTEAATALLKQAYALNLKIGKLSWAAKIAISLGKYLCAEGDPAQAEAILRDAVAEFERTDETWNHADSLDKLGDVLVFREKRTEAKPIFEKALSLWEQLRLPEKSATTRTRLNAL